uniref:Galectin n=1 Tax=Setaria digitata TaxID=48799 RepID=A0A915PRJ5_9BILA
MMTTTSSKLTVISDPVIPYMAIIPNGLFPGRGIIIKGTVLHHSQQKRFAIDLCCGLLIQGDHQDDKALHFNPRFDTSSSWQYFNMCFCEFDCHLNYIVLIWMFGPRPDRQIVLNSLIGNRWGVEERYNNVFKEGAEFSMRILVLANYFNIAVDGRHLCDYLHRLPISDIKAIYIGGNVRISTIEYQGVDNARNSVQLEAIDKAEKLSINYITRKPKMPFEMRLKDRLSHGVKVLITGTPLMNAERFFINFLTQAEHFFHFRVDFSVGDKKEAVVRNCTQHGKWQKEEREMCSFPFRRGITFDIVFYFEEKHISITVNSSHFANFNYRGFSKLVHVESITIRGDLSLQKIEFR